MIAVARKIYQRIAATGSDRTFALTRLAIISEAKSAEDDEENLVPSEETMENLRRAWQRQVRDINATRERGELIVSLWGMVLMRSYPEKMLTADFSQIKPEESENPEYRNAIAIKTEFERALRTLYPGAHPARLADLPYLEGIGPRIGCLCMLSYVTRKNELADFFIARFDRWQKQKIDQPACRRDLIPWMQTRPSFLVLRQASYAERKFKEAEDELQKADSKTSELQKKFEDSKKAYDTAQKRLLDAKKTAEENTRRFREKAETVKEAAKACYVDAPAPTSLPPSP